MMADILITSLKLPLEPYFDSIEAICLPISKEYSYKVKNFGNKNGAS